MKNYDGYLSSVLDAFATEPGSSRAAGLELLRRASANMHDPQAVARARALQGPAIADDALLLETIRDLDAFIAAQTP